MAKVIKNKICISISNDIYKFVKEYSSDKEISISTAIERILLKGIEQMENSKNDTLIKQLNNLLSTKEEITVVDYEKPKQTEKPKKVNTEELNENDKALFDIFNSIPN